MVFFFFQRAVLFIVKVDDYRAFSIFFFKHLFSTYCYLRITNSNIQLPQKNAMYFFFLLGPNVHCYQNAGG